MSALRYRLVVELMAGAAEWWFLYQDVPTIELFTTFCVAQSAGIERDRLHQYSSVLKRLQAYHGNISNRPFLKKCARMLIQAACRSVSM